MPTTNIKPLGTDSRQPSSSRRSLTSLTLKTRGRLARPREYAKLDWEPWTQDSPTDPLFPSDESMCAAGEASRTAYSIMHLTKDQLIKIHSQEGWF